MKNSEKLTELFARYLTGYAVGIAIKEDYCRTMSKIEGVPESEIKKRIEKRSDEIFEKTKAILDA